MKQNGIKDYKDLSIDYRKRQKKMFREKISKTKKAIYWANEEIDLPVEDDDVIHWWGTSANQAALSGRKN
jgi:hexosaminidase